jgi:hypothetical protein
VPLLALTLFVLVRTALAASPSACAPCHRAETAAFADSGMARALAPLREHPRFTTTLGKYSYEIVWKDDASVLIVADASESLRVPLVWAFGRGSAGQTFLFQRDGRWYESRVSYYSALNGLDLTIGMQDIVPHTLLEAAGRQVGTAEAARCFDCHATNAARPASMIAGVQCERCHGPADSHLRGAAMRKLSTFTAEQMADFCGECHRTWSQIAAGGPRGILNVRFQPYRLALSKCYDAEDRRIRCTACHDPHRPLETNAAAYDARCRACHAAAGKRVCKMGTRDCATCHMPALDLPGAHKKFTDHRIRIARAGEPYPD